MQVFLCFGGQKEIFKFLQQYCSVRIEKLHEMKLKQLVFFLQNIIIQLELPPQIIHNEPLPCILFVRIQLFFKIIVYSTQLSDWYATVSWNGF